MLLRGGTVFDGERLIGTSDVLFDGAQIIAVGPDLVAPDGHEIVDCRGHTVLPGLIDAHIHLAWAGVDPPPSDVAASRARAVRNAARLLEAGVTTARDTGGPLEVLAPVADELAADELPGPELVHCGRVLCAPGGHGTEVPVPVTIARECRGPQGFRDGVREQLAGGAGFIKVTLNGASGNIELDCDELAAVVDEAHRAGVGVACHASVRAAVALAITCGVDTIEHGNGLDVELAERMAAKNIALIATATIFVELHERGEHGAVAAQRVREHGPAVAAAIEAGVRIGFGTDRVPGGHIVAIAAEARALGRLGLSRIDVLRAATSVNADAIGRTDRGVIRRGTRADVAVFRGDVTHDVGLLVDPALVVKNGRRMGVGNL